MALIVDLLEVILYVQDMNKQVVFYRDQLGLTVTYPAGLSDYAKEFWVTLGTGMCTLVLHGGGQRRLGADSPKIVFRVTDIHAARAELLTRGVKLGEVRSPAPGVFVADGEDPEGNKFSIESHAE
jgi:predicted enzyme related to lactoylglutathione lyase